jgi:hypothetical protein
MTRVGCNPGFDLAIKNALWVDSAIVVGALNEDYQ